MIRNGIGILTVIFAAVVLAACAGKPQLPDTLSAPERSSAAEAKRQQSINSQESQIDSIPASSQPEGDTKQIGVQTQDKTILFELNNSRAARELYDQLPLTIRIENFSDNEKIFYPPEELNTANTPLAQSGAGTLAYYAPWGDVVIFYGEFSSSEGLYELGHAVSGGEWIGSLSGEVKITKNP